MAEDTLDRIECDTKFEAGEPLVRLAAEVFAATRSGEGAVSTARTPEELFARFDEPMPLDGMSIEAIAARISADILPDCNRLTHPMAMGHQVASPLPAAVWTEPVIAALNQSIAVWEMSPVATIIERKVVEWMTTCVGWGAGSGGTMTSGGTEATFTALAAARNASVPHAWTDGLGASPPVIVCGEHAHYAIARAGGELGIGIANVIAVPSRAYRMDVDELRERLDDLAASGRIVMAVVATAGSTATGSFDDLEAIGTMCEERGIWLHVDGAHGASALLSKRSGDLAGLHRARSLAWDPHKGMFLPLSAGLLLVQRASDLESAFAQKAPYLFDDRDAARNWDYGVSSFQCSRRADVFKLWVALQRYGANGIGSLYDHLCDLTMHLYHKLRGRSDFETIHEPQSNILCFRFVGAGEHSAAQVDSINTRLRAALNESGAGWITRTVLGGRPVLRVTLMNHRTRVRHVDALIERLAEAARPLEGRG